MADLNDQIMALLRSGLAGAGMIKLVLDEFREHPNDSVTLGVLATRAALPLSFARCAALLVPLYLGYCLGDYIQKNTAAGKHPLNAVGLGWAARQLGSPIDHAAARIIELALVQNKVTPETLRAAFNTQA
jgi:hypothetical protein